MMISYDAQNRNEYIGYANPGSLTSSAVWQIFRLTYDPTSGGVATRRYANRSDDFNQIWDNRESLNYTD